MLAEQDGSGARGAVEKATGAGFEVVGTPYEEFIERYFRGP